MHRKMILLLPLLLLTLFLCSCSKVDSLSSIPFSDADWSLTAPSLLEKYGEAESVVVSIYSGETYSYPREYMEREGTVKYMFAENGKLACIAWAFVTDNAEDLKALYKAIDDEEISRHGKSAFASQNATSFGDVWYLHDCDIVISTIFGNDTCGLQYAYILHEFSKH